jgi:UDP-N-acetylmuramoyl-tripeptide--D-alanyl-D-alanine ligase
MSTKPSQHAMAPHPVALLPQLPGAVMVDEPRIQQWLAAAGDDSAGQARVHSDTRSLHASDCFVALQGERFDAHAFLPEAAALGVGVALVHTGLAASGLAGAQVPDTRKALAQWAGAWRQTMDLPLIAVTGSNGKTTVTQMIASILQAAHGEHSLATAGNFNNDIGVPLTLLRLRNHHQCAVVELGMNHPGEIAGLAAMAQPTVALVNNAQREHLEFMHSVDAVAAENATVFQALAAHGAAVFPHSDRYTEHWRDAAAALARDIQVWTFCDQDDSASVYGTAQWQGTYWQLHMRTPLGELHTRVALAGQHNVRNALAAAACALASGIAVGAVEQGLRTFKAVSGRSRAAVLQRGTQTVGLVDDTYNANPDSVQAAVAVLAAMPAPRWLVLGDMGEVGAQGLAYHQEVLAAAVAAGIERIDVAGQWWRDVYGLHDAASARAAGLHWHADVDALAYAAAGIGEDLSAASVLVKGSRFMRMERIVRALEQAWPSAGHGESVGQEGARHAA